MKKYLVVLETYIEVDDAEKVVNYTDQGWKLRELSPDYSSMIRATATFEVETDNIDAYLKAMETCPDFTVIWHEEFKAE